MGETQCDFITWIRAPKKEVSLLKTFPSLRVLETAGKLGPPKATSQAEEEQSEEETNTQKQVRLGEKDQAG